MISKFIAGTIDANTTYTTLFGNKLEVERKATTNEYLNDCSKKLGTDNLFYSSSSIAKAAIKGETTTEYTNQESINNAMWSLGDSNGDGYIDKEEYDTVINSVILGKKENWATEFLANLQGMYDSAEFQTAKEQLLEADSDLDLNGDGKYTRDEFNNSIVNYLLTGYNETEE